MGKHARLASSKTEQWWECPGSMAYIEAHPEIQRPSGYHAQMGTCAHALAERVLSEGSEPEDYRDRIIVIVEKENGDEGTSILRPNAKVPKDPQTVWFEVDTDMIEAVDVLVQYVRDRCDELGVDRGAIKLEEFVVPLPDRDDTGGTADVRIDAWPEVLEVIDYKHGSGVYVPVKGNKQVRSYLLGAAIDDGFSHELYRGTIVQPRHVEGGVQSEELTADELRAWAEGLAKAAMRVDEARELVKNGGGLKELYEAGFLSVGQDGHHCTFCDTKADCPAAEKKAMELAAEDFDDEPHELAPEGENRLHVLLPWVPFLDGWLREIEASGERLLMQGGRIEDAEGNQMYKLVPKRSYRKWVGELVLARDEDGNPTETVEIKDDDHLADLLVEHGFVEKRDDVFKAPALMTGPQVEKLVPKGQERDRFNNLFLFKPPGGLTMAPIDDPREEVTVDPAADFEESTE